MSFQKPDLPVPTLNTEQMIEVDRLMIEDFGITLIQMMENAGRALALVARDRFLDGTPAEKRVTVLAGTGGNGGGALVAARRLAAWGARIQLYTTRPAESFAGVPGHQLQILQNMGIKPNAIDLPGTLTSPDLILDGLIGYSLRGAPRGRAADLIRACSPSQSPILALDAPSGLDASSGKTPGVVIGATATLTLALPKAGLLSEAAAAIIGELYLADISVPPELYSRSTLGITVGPLFARGDILRLR
jgi:NAD(P)H-hydrate epimerase